MILSIIIAIILGSVIWKLYWTPERIGKHGEQLTERKLNLINLFGRKGLVLKNIYIPKDNGETTEIDLIYVTQKGLFVIESKNYSGWIFGDSKSRYWTSCLPNGDHNRFYNPIKQNNSHIKWLGKYLDNYALSAIPFFSFIVFSDRCEFKKVPFDDPQCIICYRKDLPRYVRDVWNGFPDYLSNDVVNNVYNTLNKLTDVSEALKQNHIENINRHLYSGFSQPKFYNNTHQIEPQYSNSVPTCQWCGSPLVVRTVKEGYNAGKQFYGCSNYPKCKYTQNL